MRNGALTVERRCATSAEAVFQVLADGWSYAGWVVGASAIRDVDPGWPRLGARIHHSFGVWPLVLDDITSVVEVDRPRRLALQARAWPMGEAAVVIEVLPDEDGCRVRMSEKATRGIGRALPPVLRRIALLPRNRE
ncbi:MAG TPA: SRPBCC family protein, partial [Kineosporiaceae bacterium]|nr:SRPBCC family protein [Kineosporiaceae bacterium]